MLVGSVLYNRQGPGKASVGLLPLWSIYNRGRVLQGGTSKYGRIMRKYYYTIRDPIMLDKSVTGLHSRQILSCPTPISSLRWRW